MARHEVTFGDTSLSVAIDRGPASDTRIVTIDGEERFVGRHVESDGVATISIRAGVDDDVAVMTKVAAVDDGEMVVVWWNGHRYEVPMPVRTARRSGAGAAAGVGDSIAAPMPGTVLEVRVASGDVIEAGSVAVVMESMKMEMNMTSPRSGTVASVNVEAGAMVDLGAVLVTLEPDEAGA